MEDPIYETVKHLRWTVSEREKEIRDLKAEIARLRRQLEDRAEEEKQTRLYGLLN